MRGLLLALLIPPLILAGFAMPASAEEEAPPQNDWMVHMDKSTGEWRFIPPRIVLVPGGTVQLMVFGPGQFSLVLNETSQGADISTQEGTIRTAEFAAPTAPGEYAFHDKYHPEARGVLVVQTRAQAQPEAVIGVVPGGYESTFSPQRLVVAPGAQIRFTANGTFGHNLQAVDGSFNAGDLGPGQTSTFQAPTAPGEYPFECRFHKEQGMVGVLVVDPTIPTSQEPSPTPTDQPVAPAKNVILLTDNAFQPASLEAEPGATLTIRNVGKTPHTLTASDGTFDTGRIEPGASATLVLPGTAGRIPIYCRYHAAPDSRPSDAMAGTIELLIAPGETETQRAVPDETTAIPVGLALVCAAFVALAARTRMGRR